MGFEGFRTARCGLLDCNSYGRSIPELQILVNVLSFPMPPHVPYGLRGLPSRLWPKCNQLLRLGRP
jgi:hypothetical protein